MTERTITFSYTEDTDYEYGPNNVEVTRRLFGDDTDILESVLTEFMFFLHATGFSYVERVTVRTKHDREFSSR